jgi:hypothetical protein
MGCASNGIEERGLWVDSKQFEELIARLAKGPSRRDALKGAVGGLLTVVGVSAADDADAKDNDRGKAKKSGAKKDKDKAKQSGAKKSADNKSGAQKSDVEAEHRRRGRRRVRRVRGGRGGSSSASGAGGGGGSSTINNNINLGYGR